MITILDDIQRTTFPAMGNHVNIVVVGGDANSFAYAQERISKLEQLWSRFISTSDISRLNNAVGNSVFVADETIALLQYMVDAYRRTHGLFDPTHLPQLIQAGYSKSMSSERLTILPTGIAWSHRIEAISIDAGSRCVTLPPDVTIDAGGIGKGLAADIVACELFAAGARGALVNIGGDLRCIGEGDRNGTWEIAIEEPNGADEIQRVKLHSGAVATSSVLAKTFSDGERQRSHLIDPRADRALIPEESKVIQATVIASECVWAEALTKALILEEPRVGLTLADDLELAAMIVMNDGSAHHSTNWAMYAG